MKKKKRRARESEQEAKKKAAAERWAAARSAAEKALRRRGRESDEMRETAGGRIAELERRAASFRQRQKVFGLEWLGARCSLPVGLSYTTGNC